MGKRIKREGLDLVMETQRLMAKELLKLPKEDREAVLEWLWKAVSHRGEPTNGVPVETPPVPDPRQQDLPLEAPKEEEGF